MFAPFISITQPFCEQVNISQERACKKTKYISKRN